MDERKTARGATFTPEYLDLSIKYKSTLFYQAFWRECRRLAQFLGRKLPTTTSGSSASIYHPLGCGGVHGAARGTVKPVARFSCRDHAAAYGGRREALRGFLVRRERGTSIAGAWWAKLRD